MHEHNVKRAVRGNAKAGRYGLIVILFLASWAAASHASAVDCTPPPTGLISWWPADGNANDFTSTNHGILQGGATASAAGFVGSAFGFDGTNNYVQIPDSPSLRPTNLTVEAWVRFSALDSARSGGSTAGDQYIVFKQNTLSANFEGIALYKARMGSSDYFSFGVSSALGQLAEVRSTSTISTGAWYHVVGVRGPTNLQIFVNGVMQRQTNVAFAQDYGNFPLYFGSTGESYWDGKFKGQLDEVSLYNRALSAAEITALYSAGASGKCKGPIITAQPQTQTVAVGANVLLSVTATGTPPLNYQWLRDGTNFADGEDFSGTTSATLGFTNAQITHSADYQVIVSNISGVATSAVAVLTVDTSLTGPIITNQPVSQTVTAGTNVMFSVVATGTAPLKYRWQFNGNNLSDGGSVSGAATSNLLMNLVGPAQSGDYTVAITNVAGAVTSSVATLTVNPPTDCLWLPGLVGWWPADGGGKDLIGNNNATMQGGAVANAPGLIGQAFSMDGTNGYVQIPDSPVFHLTNLTVECWVLFSNLFTPGNTDYPHQQYMVQKQNSRQVEFEGYTLSKDTSGGPGDVFNWEVASAGGVLVAVTSTNAIVTTNTWYHLAGVRGSNYSALYFNGVLQTQAMVNFPQDYGTGPLYFGSSGQSYYERKLNGRLDEISLYNRALSAEEIATLYAAGATGKCKGTNGIGITAQPQNLTVGVGSNASFTVSATGIAPLSYQWQFNNTNIPGATAANLTVTNVQTANAGGYRAVITNPAGTVMTPAAALTVLLPPAFTLQPASCTNVPGTLATLSATAAGSPPLTYEWRLNGVPLADNAQISGTATNTLDIAAVQSAQAGDYVLVVSNAVGSVTSAVATVTVLQPPSIFVQPQSQAAYFSSSVTLTSAVNGSEPLSFQWQKDGAPVTGATSASLTLPDVRRSHSGYYALAATNPAGSVLSAEASLRIVVPQKSSVPTKLVDGSVLLSSRDIDGGMVAVTDAPFFSAWASTNLVNWELLPDALNVSNGVLWLREPSAAKYPNRFYRFMEKFDWRTPRIGPPYQ